MKHRISNFVQDLPARALSDLDTLLLYPPLRAEASARLSRTTIRELKNASFFVFPTAVADRCIDLYLASNSYAEANETAKFISINAANFSADQQRRLLSGIQGNSQVADSFEVGPLIARFRQTDALPRSEFEALLKTCGLAEYAADADDQA